MAAAIAAQACMKAPAFCKHTTQALHRLIAKCPCGLLQIRQPSLHKQVQVCQHERQYECQPAFFSLAKVLQLVRQSKNSEQVNATDQTKTAQTNFTTFEALLTSNVLCRG